MTEVTTSDLLPIPLQLRTRTSRAGRCGGRLAYACLSDKPERIEVAEQRESTMYRQPVLMPPGGLVAHEGVLGAAALEVRRGTDGAAAACVLRSCERIMAE